MNNQVIKTILNRERVYSELDVPDDDISNIISYYKNIDIYYIRSNKFKNETKFINNQKPIIIWDFNYWDLFSDYLLHIDFCKNNSLNMTQGIICQMSNYLSNKLSFSKSVSKFLREVEIEFGFSVNCSISNNPFLERIIYLSKCFAIFHEIGHYEYNTNTISVYKEMVFDLLSSLEEDDFSDLGIWSKLSWSTIRKVVNGEYDIILEEITADVFGLFALFEYLSPFEDDIRFYLCVEIMSALEYHNTFQNLFNVINRAWDAHYSEIKFQINPKEKEVDTKTNEMETARNGIGSILIVVILCKIFNLDKQQKDSLWEIRDHIHIDTKPIVNCLTDEDFICTAIEEAIK